MRIKLYRNQQQNAWMAQHDDPMVKKLFGTDTLPTPFTLNMPATVVRDKIAALNPESTVIVLE